MAAAGNSPERTAFRFTLDGDVSFSLRGARGRASLINVSMDGLSVESADQRPPVGSRPRLTLRFSDDAPSVEIEMEVLRHTETGFAGRFVDLGRDRAIELWDRIAEAAKARILEARSA